MEAGLQWQRCPAVFQGRFDQWEKVTASIIKALFINQESTLVNAVISNNLMYH